MNKYIVLGRAQLGAQKVDVHAVANFHYGLSKLWKRVRSAMKF